MEELVNQTIYKVLTRANVVKREVAEEVTKEIREALHSAYTKGREDELQMVEKDYKENIENQYDHVEGLDSAITRMFFRLKRGVSHKE